MEGPGAAGLVTRTSGLVRDSIRGSPRQVEVGRSSDSGSRSEPSLRVGLDTQVRVTVALYPPGGWDLGEG